MRVVRRAAMAARRIILSGLGMEVIMNKKRLFIPFVTMFLLFVCFVPNCIEVSAAKKKITEIYSDDITVESGRQFYIGDMIFIKLDEKSVNLPEILSTKEENCRYTATEMGATYVSDCPNVLTVEAKSGYVQTKQPGTATVTVHCMGVYASFPVTVVERGVLCAGSEEFADKIDAAGRKLAKKIPKKLNTENGYDLFQALKSYLTAFTDHSICALYGRDSDYKNIIAPACSSYERAYSMIKHYIAKYHPMCNKKYWTAEKGKYFTVSATSKQITINMKKKLTKQALLALYLEEFMYEVDGGGPDGVIYPLAINTTVQKDRLEARSFIGKYKDADDRYIGHTVTLFKLGSKTGTVTHVYRTRYNPANGKFKFHHKKKLALKKGKKFFLRIHTFNFYWPGEFVVK